MAIRILIVDDHEIVRLGVRTVLSGNPKWEVCGEAVDGEHAIRLFMKLTPDVVILDLSLPGMNGFEVAKEMRRIAPFTKIIFFSMHDIPVITSIVGADAFVSKTSRIEEITATLERVLHRCAAARA